jgi:hypothetical protein
MQNGAAPVLPAAGKMGEVRRLASSGQVGGCKRRFKCQVWGVGVSVCCSAVPYGVYVCCKGSAGGWKN